MPPQLFALHEGPSILLDKPVLLVGRHQECDIQLPSRKISRRHCCIAQVKDHLVVRDLSSTNGIRINGVRVAEGCLRPGDELTIGNFRYQLRWEGPAGPGARDGNRRATAPQTAGRPDALESCELPVALNEASELAQEPPPGGLPIGLPPTAFTADKRARAPLPPLRQPGSADSDVQHSGDPR
jgi:predicted component of type VI protein secretion system